MNAVRALAARGATPGACLRRCMPALALVVGLTGCAGLQPPQRDHLDSGDARLAECARWYRALDSAVTRAGVADIAARRIAGFPYLRVDRFLAASRYRAREDEQLRAAWIDAMRALDDDGRRVEIANLPAAALGDLAAGGREALLARARECAALMLDADLADAAAVDRLHRRAFVPDDYSSLKRALGLYELTRLPFHAGVRAWQRRVEQGFDAARRGLRPADEVLRYVPAGMPVYSRRQVGEILDRAAGHPLGLLHLSAVERERLFATYAPVFEIETSGDYDRIGRLYWPSVAAPPRVDVTRPVIYHRLAYTRVGNATLPQLVYVAWFPQRPLDGSFDLLGGDLDGVVWRVTLARDGEPVLFDSIHPCGCYHMFFPTPRVEPLPPPRQTLEWAFVPATLPALAESERVVLALQTRSHYLRGVTPAALPAGIEYEFVEYDELRSLPLPRGGRRSLFGPDGLVAGTERGERFLFWPMGIASPGAMRQAGSHATAFVGRRHFDDADLLERRFRFRE